MKQLMRHKETKKGGSQERFLFMGNCSIIVLFLAFQTDREIPAITENGPSFKRMEEEKRRHETPKLEKRREMVAVTNIS